MSGASYGALVKVVAGLWGSSDYPPDFDSNEYLRGQIELIADTGLHPHASLDDGDSVKAAIYADIAKVVKPEASASIDMQSRLARIVGEIELGENFSINLSTDEDGAFFQIAYYRRDIISGEMGYGYGGRIHPRQTSSDSQIIQTIFGLYKSFWEHESRETFQWRGRRVFGPHISTEALWDVARRVDKEIGGQ
jgi:hypothetical protein